jgi:hypothetical protein
MEGGEMSRKVYWFNDATTNEKSHDIFLQNNNNNMLTIAVINLVIYKI